MTGNKKIFLINICFIAIIAILSIFMVNSVLKSSFLRTKETGQQMSENFRLKDDTIFTEYRTILEVAAYKIKTMRLNGKSIEEIHRWVQDYAQTTIYSPISCSTGVYAYVDGHFLNRQDKPRDGYDATTRIWYKNAILSNGGINYSDVYIDDATGKKVVTLSIKMGERDVAGIDVFLDDIKGIIKNNTLAKGNLHVTYDRKGEVIIYKGWNNNDLIHNEEYFKDLFDAIIENKNTKSFDYVDMYGNKNVVYSSIGETGWYSVSCISYDNILNKENIFVKNVVGFLFIYIALLFIYMYRSFKNERKAEKTREIMDFIANTYFAVYSVDTKNNTCDIIKSTPDVVKRMENSKSYDKLLNVMAESVELDAYNDFCSSFSLSNLKRIIQNKIEIYGGDYKQRFLNNEYKWVKARVLFSRKSFSKNQIIIAFKLIDKEKIKELEQKKLLEESLESAQASSRAKNDFLSNMSHDMRTPLNAIIGLSELAEIHSDKTSEVYEYLKKINLSSKHLLGLINDVLDMAKIEQGKIELREDELDIVDFVTDTVSVFKKQAEDKNISLKFDIKNRMLISDTLRLSQILNNIISNAVKFSNEGGNIDINVIQSDTNYKEYGIYQFSVKDYGIGMSDEFIEKIFIPFEREERFGCTHIMGTGLGMPIVKNIVQVMNGKIDIKSKINKGSKFTVTIPMLYLDKKIDVDEKDNENKSISDLNGIKILLVEDNEINMEITTEILEMYGGEVTKAWNGKEAVDTFLKYDENYFDVILMDMQMPVLDGCKATKEIRDLSRADAKKIPIIAVTANAFSDDIAKSMNSGMNAHIAKPIDFNNLINVLSKYL